jgi:CRP-like cAMP-binding protein
VTIEEDIAFLERIPSLALLGRPALRILAIGAETRNLNSGDVLFHAGEAADAGYVVQHGALVLNSSHADDPDRGAVVGPSALLGELALLIETVRPVTAKAAETTSVIRISRSLFLKMLEGFPDAAQRLREHIASRAEQTAAELGSVREYLHPRAG